MGGAAHSPSKGPAPWVWKDTEESPIRGGHDEALFLQVSKEGDQCAGSTASCLAEAVFAVSSFSLSLSLDPAFCIPRNHSGGRELCCVTGTLHGSELGMHSHLGTVEP